MAGPTREEPEGFDRYIPWILGALAGTALVGAALRMFSPGDPVLARLDSTTLLYLGVAGALLLLPRVQSLAFGDYKVEFHRIERLAQEAHDSAKIAQDAATYGLGPKVRPDPFAGPKLAAIQPGTASDDPWKGVFGGKPESNKRRLKAHVTPLRDEPEWFLVELSVEPTAPRTPLAGPVQFFLHNTFDNDRPVVPTGFDGRVALRLKAYGAFTVGALTDGGDTRLELDLAELEQAPEEFRTR